MMEREFSLGRTGSIFLKRFFKFILEVRVTETRGEKQRKREEERGREGKRKRNKAREREKG